MRKRRPGSPSAGEAPALLRAEYERIVSKMPASVRAAIPCRLWDRERLFALDLPIIPVPVAGLRWILDIHLWADGGEPFRVTPNQVRAHPGRFPNQWARVTAADPAWPIHLVWFNGRWTILDGVHRVLKADMLGETTIPAMVLSEEDFQGILYGDAGGVTGTASTFHQDSA